jgi:hypothetical protein
MIQSSVRSNGRRVRYYAPHKAPGCFVGCTCAARRPAGRNPQNHCDSPGKISRGMSAQASGLAEQTSHCRTPRPSARFQRGLAPPHVGRRGPDGGFRVVRGEGSGAGSGFSIYSICQKRLGEVADPVQKGRTLSTLGTSSFRAFFGM